MHDVGASEWRKCPGLSNLLIACQQCEMKLSVLPTLVKTLCCAFAASTECLQTLFAQDNMLRNLVPDQHILLVENLAVTELVVKMFQQEKHYYL